VHLLNQPLIEIEGRIEPALNSIICCRKTRVFKWNSAPAKVSGKRYDFMATSFFNCQFVFAQTETYKFTTF